MLSRSLVEMTDGSVVHEPVIVEMAVPGDLFSNRLC
jgi:hypothetical protein